MYDMKHLPSSEWHKTATLAILHICNAYMYIQHAEMMASNHQENDEALSYGLNQADVLCWLRVSSNMASSVWAAAGLTFTLALPLTPR